MQKNFQGIGLLECLIALLIFSVVILAFAKFALKSLDNSKQALVMVQNINNN